MKVLIAEDERLSSVLMQKLLGKLGHGICPRCSAEHFPE
jgi:hypothetical protein